MVSQKKDVVSLQRLPSPIKLFYWPFLKRSSAPILEMSLSFLPKLIAKLIWIRSQALERCSFTAGPSLGCRLRSPVCRVCPARGDGLWLSHESLVSTHTLCVHMLYRQEAWAEITGIANNIPTACREQAELWTKCALRWRILKNNPGWVPENSNTYLCQSFHEFCKYFPPAKWA